MAMFDDFFAFFSDLNKSFDFSIAIKRMYELLPDVFINTLALCLILTMLAGIVSFIKGWF